MQIQTRIPKFFPQYEPIESSQVINTLTSHTSLFSMSVLVKEVKPSRPRSRKEITGENNSLANIFESGENGVHIKTQKSKIEVAGVTLKTKRASYIYAG